MASSEEASARGERVAGIARRNVASAAPRTARFIACSLACSLAMSACRDSGAHVIDPAPQPAAPLPEPQPELPRGVDPPGTTPKREPAEAHPQEPTARTQEPRAERRSESAAAEHSEHRHSEPPAPKPSKPLPAPAPTAPSPPAPAAAATPAAAPARHTQVPSSSHVHPEIPAGLQALLDADSRMQPWVEDVMRVVERCYASELQKNPSAAGSIVAEITMHKDDRPDIDIKSLPPQLSGLVPCGTGDLMRNRMPLFTGPEGQRQTLALRFTP